MSPRDPIVAAFAETLARRPAAPLVATASERATVAEVDALALAVAARLGPPRPGAAIGFAAPNGPAFLAGYLALRRRGEVPILLDAALPAERRREIVAALGGTALLSAASGWPASAAEFEVSAAVGERPVTLSPELGAIKLSSGSTGAPRGIAVSAAALVADDEQLTRAMGLGAGERMVAAVPLSHSYGFASLALPALLRGTLLAVPAERSPLAPLAVAAALEATFLPTVPAFLAALVRLAAAPPLPPSLRLIVSAGAPLAAETAVRLRERFGRSAHVFYGASECGGIAYDRAGDAAERGTVGEPIPGVEVTIDAAAGRLAIRSPALAEGYLPEPSPDLAGGRFLAGDLAEFVGGEIALRGRADDLINVRGKKVNPREVEEVLRHLPGVEEVAVVGLPSAGGDLLRAVLACPGQKPGYDEVAAFARQHLPEHKVPKSLLVLPALPRTARGKLDREALRATEPAAK